MASVRKKENSKYWYACITGPDGKPRQFSTGLDDRKESLAVATAAERALHKHVADAHPLREAFDRLAKDFAPEFDTDPAKWLLAWAESRQGEVAASSLASYRNLAKEAAEWLVAAGIGAFSEFTQARVVEMRQSWLTTNTARTANGKIKVLRVALNVAIAEGLINRNPAIGINPLKEIKTRRREFRPAEIEVLKAVLHGEWKAMFYLGLNTGQRLNDLAVLQWRQVDIAQRTITFTTAKTDRLVCLPLLDASISALSELPSSDDANAQIFPAIAGVKAQARSNQFREILASVGLAEPVSHRKKETASMFKLSELSFHSLRHTTTSLLKAAGVSNAMAMEIVGHSSVAVSRGYTHFDLDTMRKEMEKMDS